MEKTCANCYKHRSGSCQEERQCIRAWHREGEDMWQGIEPKNCESCDDMNCNTCRKV